MEKDKNIAAALAILRAPRPCRVCGMTFQPERADALTCSSTCRTRRKRGGDLAYLANLPKAAAREARRDQGTIAELMSELKRHNEFRKGRGRVRRIAQETADQWFEVGHRLALKLINDNPEFTRNQLFATICEMMLDCPTMLVATIVDDVLASRSGATRVAEPVAKAIATLKERGRDMVRDRLRSIGWEQFTLELEPNRVDLIRTVVMELKMPEALATEIADEIIDEAIVPTILPAGGRKHDR